MSWRRATGVLAVLLVIGSVLGTLATLVSANDLLTGSDQQVAAIGSVVLLAVVLAGVVLLGSPSREWVGNPYW